VQLAVALVGPQGPRILEILPVISGLVPKIVAAWVKRPIQQIDALQIPEDPVLVRTGIVGLLPGSLPCHLHLDRRGVEEQELIGNHLEKIGIGTANLVINTKILQGEMITSSPTGTQSLLE